MIDPRSIKTQYVVLVRYCAKRQKNIGYLSFTMRYTARTLAEFAALSKRWIVKRALGEIKAILIHSRQAQSHNFEAFYLLHFCRHC